MFSVDVTATVVILAIASLLPRFGSIWFRAVERRLRLLACRPGLSVAVAGVLALGGSAAVSLLGQMPVPAVQDEFSYLLAANTFASGRLSNPTHPMWVHFESMHIIQQPTYASKYPPGQGLVLAAGQGVFGHPVVGVWISAGLAAASICWMLQAWLPAWWALLGGILAALRLGTFMPWSQSYWGGLVPVVGGALVWGAVRRLIRRRSVGDALLMGCGLAVLANSRPYEGLLVSLPAGAVLLGWMAGKDSPAVRVTMRKVVAPLCAVLSLTAIAMGFYNMRVTGDPFRMPYVVHEETYGIAPVFLWQPLRPEPMYRHKVLRDYHEDMAQWYEQQRSLPGFLRVKGRAFRNLLRFYVGPALAVSLVMLPWVLRDRWMRFGLITCGVLALGMLAETWILNHYAAPITGLIFALALRAMRHLSVWRWRGRPLGRSVVMGILIVLVVTAPGLRAEPREWSLQRARILASLKEEGDRHLVLVRYWPGHKLGREWVYNEADIDGARVVWAREMDAAQDRELLEYFKDRRVWLLEADAEPPRLSLYPMGSES
jgi:hypothetical protein